MSKSALVFGASGVTGWSFINEILTDYPKPNIWKRAHALTNRPLYQEQSQWPDDIRLDIVSGIDLLANSQQSLEQELIQKIPDIGKVTHVYYLAYKAGTDVQKELEEAVEMWEKALTAVDKLCPELEFVVLQTGAKMCKPTLFLRNPIPHTNTNRWLPPPRHGTLLCCSVYLSTPLRIPTSNKRRVRRHALLPPAA